METNITMQQLKEQRLTEQEKTNLGCIKEIFKHQTEKYGPVDAERFSKMKLKTYENGEPIKIGDVILYALLQISDSELKVIALKNSHLNMFECIELKREDAVPLLKYK